MTEHMKTIVEELEHTLGEDIVEQILQELQQKSKEELIQLRTSFGTMLHYTEKH